MVRLTDRPDMTIAVYREHKNHPDMTIAVYREHKKQQYNKTVE